MWRSGSLPQLCRMPIIWDAAHVRPIHFQRTRVSAPPLLISIRADICISHKALERVSRSDAQMNNGWLWEGPLVVLLNNKAQNVTVQDILMTVLKNTWLFQGLPWKKIFKKNNQQAFSGCSHKSGTLKPDILRVCDLRPTNILERNYTGPKIWFINLRVRGKVIWYASNTSE